MAFLNAQSSPLINDNFLDVLVSGEAWDLSESRIITWALSDGFNDFAWVDRAAAIEQFTRAVEVFELYINVDFQYLGDYANPTLAGEAGADVVYTVDNTPTPPGEIPTLAYAFFPSRGAPVEGNDNLTSGGDIFMNFAVEQTSSSSFGYGSDGFHTIIHELGHAMGLKHPHANENDRPTMSDVMSTDMIDMDWFTMMSYEDQNESEMERWDAATPMVMDVIALQYMYGPNTTTNAGDSSLLLESTNYYYSIWDASGNDRVDASAQSEGWTILLPDTQPTTLVPTLAGMALPSSQFSEDLQTLSTTELIWLLGDIENATGSQFNDRIDGNRYNNDIRGGGGNDELEGGGGNDVLNGNGGIDVAYYGGLQSSFTLTLSPDGMNILDRRPDGTGFDSLVNVETLQFYEAETFSSVNLLKVGGPASLSGADLLTFIELYIAYFNRAPDANGLAFWGSAFANGTTLQQMATLFIDQPETQSIYAESLSNEDFATVVYGNVLGRVADQDGYNFWVGLLNSERVQRDQFILSVLEGAKADPDPNLGPDFAAQQLADREYLATKTDIGALYAVHRGMSDLADASDVMALFDGSQSSHDAAIASVENLYQAALDPVDGKFLMPLIGVLDNPHADIGVA